MEPAYRLLREGEEPQLLDLLQAAFGRWPRVDISVQCLIPSEHPYRLVLASCGFVRDIPALPLRSAAATVSPGWQT